MLNLVRNGLLSLLMLSPALAGTPLPRDPQNSYGRLDNGMKYIIRPHDNPPDRVAFFMHVDTGALNETAQQNGLAHFLEHMAFNGSKHFEPGTLIPYLNKLGMRFGADSNAHTNLEETVYKLFMPDTKPETIDKALTILSDFAGRLLLKEEEIDKERKVILEEARARKSAMQRLRDEWMKQVFAGTRLAVHDVIGDEEQIKKFTREQFEDYWNAWYRPENVTLIVVGQIEPEPVLAEIKKHFDGFKARADRRPPTPAELRPVDKARAFVLTDPEQVGGRVEMLAIRAARPPITTMEQFEANEIENLGTWIVSRRLEDRVKKGEASFHRAAVVVTDMVREAILPMGTAMGEPEDWNKILEQLIVEVHGAIEHGFTQRELDLAREELLAGARREVETESTKSAQRLINELSHAVGQRLPILSAEQNLKLIEGLCKSASLDAVHATFVENFKTKHFTYTLYLPSKIKPPTSEDVLAAAAEAWARKTKAPKKEKAAESILARLPEPGKVEESHSDDQLGITTLRFANGVVCHHRFMDYKKDSVMMHLTLVGGQLQETAKNRGIADAAAVVFGVPATGRLDSTQVRDIMTGKNIEVSGGAGLDTVTIMIGGSPKDLETGLQLMYALLTDGKLEAAGFENWRKSTAQRVKMFRLMVQGQLQETLQEVFFGGDVRFNMLTQEQLDALSVEKAQAWYDRLVKNAPIEVAIVGDLSLEKAMPLLSRYVGGLPNRSADFKCLDSLRKLDRSGGPYEKTVHFETQTPKGLAMAGFVGCDERNVVDRRRLTVIARILTDRMTQRIREDEQLVYGIGCRNQPATAIPGTGLFVAAAPTDPQTVERLADEVLEMMRQFAEEGPTVEEVDTAKKQILTDLDTQMKEPMFWLERLDEWNYRGRSLDELKQLKSSIKKLTAEQLQEAARKYFTDTSALRFAIIPKSSEKESASDANEKPRPQRRRRRPAMN